MKNLLSIPAVLLLLVLFHPAIRAEERASEDSLYFPPDGRTWDTIEPEQVGWDGAKLQKALDYAGENQSSGVVILYRGRILAEQYFEVQGAKSAKYGERALGKDGAGHAIEDVASAQKSVASILVGIAQQKGLLKLEDRVSQHLGVGWSRATPEQENAITVRHLITMTSGLNQRGRFEATPGTRWSYNTTVYAKSMDVVAVAAGMDRHELTSQWLTQPLGMSNSGWIARQSAALQSVNGFGFATTARDLARFGLMMLAEGRWEEEAILADPRFFKEATTSSQKLNPFYGNLWWLNHNANATSEERRIATAPSDMVSANGALNRRCFVVPSLQLVVTRLGDNPAAGRVFDRRFWQLLIEAAPAESRR